MISRATSVSLRREVGQGYLSRLTFGSLTCAIPPSHGERSADVLKGPPFLEIVRVKDTLSLPKTICDFTWQNRCLRERYLLAGARANVGMKAPIHSINEDSVLKDFAIPQYCPISKY